jgi:hypothetical protein
MEITIMGQDDVLRVRHDTEIHGAIFEGENRYELVRVERDVQFVDDAKLTFVLSKEEYILPKFDKLKPIDYKKIPKAEKEVLRKWFNKNISQMLPAILSYSTSEENLSRLQEAVKEGVPIIITSGVDTDHSHILMKKELFGL